MNYRSSVAGFSRRWVGYARVFLVGLFLVGLALSCPLAYADAGDPIQFTQWGSVSPAAGWSFVAGDFNGDGRVDVMGYNSADGTLWVGINTGSNFSFTQWGSVSPAAGWSFVAGDFNGHGRVDVMGYYPGNGTLWVGTNTGSSFSFTQWGSVSPAAGWSFVAGDFNGNGRLDVMGYYPGNGTLWVGTNTGSSFSFTQWASVSPAAGWSFVAGDFTRDGRVDVVGYHPSNGSLWVGANTGSSFSFSKWASVSPIDGWSFVPGRFAGDGNIDLVGYSSNDGTLFLLRNVGANFYLEPKPWGHVNPASGWSFQAADFTGDGLIDIVGYHPSNGSLWVGQNMGLPPEGYAWPLSAAPGQSIQFMVSGVGDPTVTFFRHTTDTTGATVSLQMGTTTWTPAVRALPSQPWVNGCGWPLSFSYTIPSNWPSGIYSARLQSSAGAFSYITFVVKPDPTRTSSLAVIANVNTWLAYNEYGGRGKYDGAAHVSFLRPAPDTAPFGEGFGNRHQARAELWILGWLEQQGYHPDVYTDIDFHNGIPSYPRIVLSTHPEYFSTQEYMNLRSFLDSGGSLVYLGGNGIYESGTYYVDQMGMVFLNGVENGDRTPAQFRNIGLPEMNLLGIAYSQGGVSSAPYQVVSAASPVFAGTGIQNGDLIGTLGLNIGVTSFTLNGEASGWEIDTTDPSSPAAGSVVAHGLNSGGGAEMVLWTYQPGGGTVFSAGSITFGGSLAIDPSLQQIVRNALGPP